MQPEVLGYKVQFESWIKQLPKAFTAKDTFIPTLEKLWNNWVDETI
jgi:hypothetical protein